MSEEEKDVIDVEAKEVADESPSQPKEGAKSDSGPQKPAEDDKFMEFTKKATSGAEKAIGAGYTRVKDAISKGNFEPRKTIALIDRIIDWAKKTFPPESFQSLSDWSAKYGHAGLVCAQVLTVVYFTVKAIRLSSWPEFFFGLGYAALLVILQYTADKFLTAGDTLIKSSPSKLSSEAFLNCLALTAEAVGIVVLVIAISHKSWAEFVMGLGFWAICDGIAYVAINPSLANIEVNKNTAAGEEAIGILSFIVKAVVRIVPFAFGVGAILGSVALFLATLAVLFKGQAGVTGNPVELVLFCACLPFASYILFTVYHLIIDVLRAILVIPGKLDKLNKTD